ncbi:hypothetical protein NE237_032009 [Protea cynaroides]|uniref:Casein kinase substrate phosphoprotein PP28 domain-containing protein n=1 Tax=Protea cynaroides TaxID=273540 RepID=A0A9Q0L294_9MAGN|nr:hypothetical protein NE237_032009 [Protea cynaroides]
MGRGKFKGKPTGRRQFSTPEEMLAGTSTRPRTFKKAEVEDVEEEEDTEESEESEEDSEEPEKRKGTQGIIEIQNPNLEKTKNVKARDVDLEKTTELSRREREEIEKQKAHERYMRLQEQGKTEQARKDLERLSMVRQQRAEAAKKREEEKQAKEQKKTEARKRYYVNLGNWKMFYLDDWPCYYVLGLRLLLSLEYHPAPSMGFPHPRVPFHWASSMGSISCLILSGSPLLWPVSPLISGLKAHHHVQAFSWAEPEPGPQAHSESSICFNCDSMVRVQSL